MKALLSHKKMLKICDRTKNTFIDHCSTGRLGRWFLHCITIFYTIQLNIIFFVCSWLAQQHQNLALWSILLNWQYSYRMAQHFIKMTWHSIKMVQHSIIMAWDSIKMARHSINITLKWCRICQKWHKNGANLTKFTMNAILTTFEKHRENRVYSLMGFNDVFLAFSLNINKIA